jgi:hypothetical protein
VDQEGGGSGFELVTEGQKETVFNEGIVQEMAIFIQKDH